MKTRVAIVGCGGIARFHYEGCERAGARIVHVCDVRPDAAQRVADRYHAKVSTDYRRVMDDPEVDLVSVCTISRTHREICLAAIAAGKGVICEKTLTERAEDSWEVARAAKDAGVFFAVAYMKNFFPAVRRAKELLREMGPVISLYARTWQPFPSLWERPLSEAFLRRPSSIVERYGGGVLVCGGSHILDLIHQFAGPPVRVVAALRQPEELDFDVQANALLWLPAGGVAHFEACWHPLRFAGYERNGWDERLEINTPRGRLELFTVKWDQPMNNGALLVHQDAETGQVTEYRFPAVNVFDVEMAEMLRQFEAGERGFPSAWDGYVVDELIAHMRVSAAGGRVVEVRYREL